MDEQTYNLEQSIAELGRLLDLSAKETDKATCEALAEKARIIYEQYPESEDTALRYARILFNLSVEQENVEELGKTVNSVKQIFEKFNQSEDIALHYAMALVNLSAKQDNVEDLLKTSKEVKQIFEQFKDSEDIALQYAMLLYNLSNRQNDIKERKKTISDLEALTLKFQHSENIALQYATALVNLSAEQINVEERKNTANLVKQIFEQFKDSEDIALQYAMVLYNLSNRQNDAEERKETISEIEALTLKFQHSENIALRYAMALANLSVEQENVEDLLKTSKEVKQIFEQFKDSEDIALRYAKTLVNLSVEQDNVEDRLNTANEVKQIFDRFNHSESIALQYAMALVNLSVEQDNVEDLLKTSNAVKQIFDSFKHSEDIALRYVKTLVNLSVEQDNVEDRLNTVNEIKQFFESFKHSESFALHYAMALVNLSAKQDNVEDRLNTVNSVKEIFELFRHSKDIALQCAKTLFNLSNLQNDIKQKQDIVNRILDILKNFSSVEILNILVDILQNNSDITLDTDKIPTTSLTKILDKLCLNSNIDTDRDLLIRTLNLKLTSGRKLVVNTKYDILNSWIENYKNVKDKDKLNQLIDIYKIIQEIKFKLGLKEDNKKLQFGHYTKGATLQVILKQEENEKKEEKKNIFSVSGKTRLYNASYMNDPEEGLVIEKVLKSNKEGKISSYFEKRDILDPSSWFLMSFTSKTDDLAMWSQYGDDAQGVCLVLKEDDFSRFTSFNDVSWRKETLLLESENKSEVAISESSSDFKSSPNKLENNDSNNSIYRDETQLKSEQKDNISKGSIDYLYRIAYIKNKDKDFELEKSELFDDDEIKELDESVNHLKQKLEENLVENDPFYKKAISECIEEIRYLFKSVDYKYENELRILRYANLDPSNQEIKIDMSSGIGKLYVERENPIQIDEVIFGPKFPNPEYVTPLLKLLDESIDYTKSTIKFR